MALSLSIYINITQAVSDWDTSPLHHLHYSSGWTLNVFSFGYSNQGHWQLLIKCKTFVILKSDHDMSFNIVEDEAGKEMFNRYWENIGQKWTRWFQTFLTEFTFNIQCHKSRKVVGLSSPDIWSSTKDPRYFPMY